jgi:hypothetical protein
MHKCNWSSREFNGPRPRSLGWCIFCVNSIIFAIQTNYHPLTSYNVNKFLLHALVELVRKGTSSTARNTQGKDVCLSDIGEHIGCQAAMNIKGRPNHLGHND